MATMVDAKASVRVFRDCMGKNGNNVARCQTEAMTVVNQVASVTSKECQPFVEDVQKCITHKFKLSTCNDDTVGQMLKCQDKITSYSLK